LNWLSQHVEFVQKCEAHRAVGEPRVSTSREAVSVQEEPQKRFICPEQAQMESDQLVEQVADLGVAEVDNATRHPASLADLAKQVIGIQVCVEEEGRVRAVEEGIDRRHVFFQLREQTAWRAAPTAMVLNDRLALSGEPGGERLPVRLSCGSRCQRQVVER